MVTVELLLKTLMKIYCDSNMTVELINSGGDNRGKIFFFKSENLKINFFEINKDSVRGGHYHDYPVTYVLISGKIEHRMKSLDTNEEIIETISSPAIIKLPINTANLIFAIKNSIFLEMFDVEYESKIFDEYRNYVIDKNKILETDESSSNLSIENQFQDSRGKIFFCKFGDININLIEINEGYARGGHFHNFDSEHIILTGEIKYFENDLITNSELVKIIKNPEIIITKSNIAHMFLGIKNSYFVETFSGNYDAIFFNKYRKIVDEKMKN